MRCDDNMILKIYLFLEFNLKKVSGKIMWSFERFFSFKNVSFSWINHVQGKPFYNLRLFIGQLIVFTLEFNVWLETELERAIFKGVPSFIPLANKNWAPSLCKAKLDEKRFLGGDFSEAHVPGYPVIYVYHIYIIFLLYMSYI